MVVGVVTPLVDGTTKLNRRNTSGLKGSSLPIMPEGIVVPFMLLVLVVVLCPLPPAPPILPTPTILLWAQVAKLIMLGYFYQMLN